MFPLVFYQLVFHEKVEHRIILKNVIACAIFAVPSILCMMHPIIKQPGMIFDFRIIPLILSSFYGNNAIFLLVSSALIVSRFWMGGHGAYINLISSILTIALVFFFSKKYGRLNLKGKITICVLTSYTGKFFGILFNLYFDPAYNLMLPIAFYAMQSIFMGFTVYIMETILKNSKLRKELIDSEKMKVASIISASVAHEIRNPLTAVRGFIQLLAAANVSADKKQMYSKVCLDELDRAQQIITDYLCLARPHPDVIEHLSLKEEIIYVSSVLVSYANLKGVELQVQLEENAYVTGDRQKFRQSIINLVKNGIEAMDFGGKLVVSLEKQSEDISLIITDSGKGMTLEQINRLGTPYFSTKDKGTGLGTMVAFSIIKSMMGKIKVESQLGKGTVYKITFPAVAQTKAI
ncbi:sensor histidine kinase [Paenibacillus thalictri]|nr:sensor histidine kinase [Paenibacillus thalictri]